MKISLFIAYTILAVLLGYEIGVERGRKVMTRILNNMRKQMEEWLDTGVIKIETDKDA